MKERRVPDDSEPILIKVEDNLLNSRKETKQ